MDFAQAADQVTQLRAAGVPSQDITAHRPHPAFSTRWSVSAKLAGPLHLMPGSQVRLLAETRIGQLTPGRLDAS